MGHDNFVVSNGESKITKDGRSVEKPLPEPVISVVSRDIQSLEELDQKVEDSYSKKSDGLFSCHYCVKSFKKKGHAKEHVETHFEGLSFPCPFCDAILRSRNSYRLHSKRQH